MDISGKPIGLTAREVAAKISAGKTNAYSVESGKSTWRIIVDNTFNLFILLNALIAITLIIVGSYANALFIAFVAVGVISGIVVEIRARNLVNKLNLLNKITVTAIRDNAEVTIDSDAIVLGDIIKFSAGDQIPADASIIQGFVEVNEALITGESDLLVRKDGDKLLSGSFIASGQCYAKIKKVGADSYVAKLATEAKASKPIQSEIIGSVRILTRFTSRVILPLGLILLLEALLLKQDTIQGSVVSTSAILIGMLPKGLVVLTIIALITAVFKLGRKKVLIQDIYSVETMARIDTLCLDKTGTLTDGKMYVRDLKPLSSSHTKKSLRTILGSYLQYSTDHNSTINALRATFATNDKYPATQSIPFSSDRKWGAVYLKGIGMLVMGAPERIYDRVPAQVVSSQHKGRRVLGLGITDKLALLDQERLTDIQPIAMIELEDGIRKDAEKTLSYLRKQGVELRVISGDHPVTVSKIAERAGFKDSENYLDVSALSNEELRRAIPSTAIFGRVDPHQKRFIIRELKSLDKTVAMTGDGVNDILALREADLSIVMAAGDPAAKQISNIVLLESSFSDLPDILFEGRRVLNNMFRVSSIFFIKTIYSFFVAILCALSPLTGAVIVFPFIALQITLIDQVLEGFPTLFMSFEGDKSQPTKRFLRDSLLRALPQSIMITIALVVIHFFCTRNHWEQTEMVTLMYHALGTITIIGLFKACLPFSKFRTFLFTVSAVGFYVSAFIVGSWRPMSELFHLEVLSGRALIFLLLIAATAITTALLLHFLQRRRAAIPVVIASAAKQSSRDRLHKT